MGEDLAFCLSYPPAAALHFWLNRAWTFAGGATSMRRQVPEYLLMVVASFVLQAAVFKAVTALTSFPGWIAAGIANVSAIGLSFLAMQHRVFKQAKCL